MAASTPSSWPITWRVRGPLNIARPVQGWPVIVQAGASEAGRQLAAETAEIVFSGASEFGAAQAYYADLQRRMAACGRAPGTLKVLPGAFVMVATTDAEAHGRKALLDSLVHPDSGLATLSVMLGCDTTHMALDEALPAIPESNASRSGRQKLVDMARERHMTVRQLAQYVGGSFGTLELIGSPTTVVDQMEAWFHGHACDGFNIMFPHLPGGLDDFVELVVPELQRRGLFRRAYRGATLREHLGLARPANRHF